MKLSLQYRGRIFHILAIDLDNGSCPAVGFLEQVKRRNPASHKSLVNLYMRHADFGHIRNIRKSRAIEGRQNLLEFKSKQGDRLLYFYLSGSRTVLAHGFHKGAPAKAEYDKAEKMRDQYLREVENG